MLGLSTSSGGWTGFINSDIPIPVCVAKGEVVFNAQIKDRYGRHSNSKYGGVGDIGSVNISKYFNIPLFVNQPTPWGNEKAWNPELMVFYYTSTGDAVHLFWGQPWVDGGKYIRVNETATNCTVSNNFWLTTTPNSGANKSGTFRVLVFASLPSGSQLPDYGLQMKGSSGQTTYNSNYMPLLIRGLSNPPDFDPNNPWRHPVATGVGGVNNSRKPATIADVYLGSSNTISGGTCFSPVASYSTALSGVISVPWARDGEQKNVRWAKYYSGGFGYTRMPVIHTDDYF